MQEKQVWSLGREDSLQEEMATHSSILAWEIPRTEEPGRLQSWRQLSNWTTKVINYNADGTVPVTSDNFFARHSDAA